MIRSRQIFSILLVWLFFISDQCCAYETIESFRGTSESDSLLEKGIKLYLDGRYGDAINVLEAAHPDAMSPTSFFYLGMSHAALNEFESANKAFIDAIRSDSVNLIFRSYYGQFLSRAGAIDEAVRHLKTAFSLDSTFYPACSQLAQLCEFWQKETAAYRQRLWVRVLELNPNDHLALYYHGVTMFRQKMVDSGFACLKKAIALNSNFYLAILELAHRNLERKNYEEAFRYYQEALRLRADNPKLLYEVAEVYRKRNELQKSIFYFRRSIELDTTNAAYCAQLGLVYFYLGRFDSSVASFRKAIALDKDNYTYYLNLGLAYEKMDSTELAVKALEAAIVVSDPGRTSNLYERLGNLLSEKKRYNEAKMSYGRALEVDPSNHDVLLYLGYLYEHLHDQARAIQQYREYLKLIESDSTMSDQKQTIEGRLRYLERTKRK